MSPDVRPLRIGIDGRAFSSPAPGIRRYTAGVARALIALGEPLQVMALGGADTSALPPGMAHIAEPPHPPTNVGWTLVGLPRAARRAAVDVIHAPAYTAPFWSPVPAVVTVHDVSYALHPEWYPYRRDWVRRGFYRYGARAAAHVLTVSRFSATEIARAYDIPADRITVTPLGVDAGFGPPTGAPVELPPGVVLPFVLHVGDLHERRNLQTALDAVVAARRTGEAAGLTLVLVGTDRGVIAGLHARAEAAGVRDAVLHLGTVPETQLRALYHAATALVYPSLYEGFGLPLIEAMASGTPVLGANAASIPEVLGDGGVLLDPRDTAAWTRAMIGLAKGEGLDALRAAGLRRSAEFTWRRTAQLTLDVFRRVA